MAIRINGVRTRAMLADTPLKRTIGLMYRKGISRSSSMLFVFANEGKHGIWMRNMNFPIDVIWLDVRKKVVHLEENLQPCTVLLGCKTYHPNKAAKYVMEAPPGFIEKSRIRKNQAASFKL